MSDALTLWGYAYQAISAASPPQYKCAKVLLGRQHEHPSSISCRQWEIRWHLRLSNYRLHLSQYRPFEEETLLCKATKHYRALILIYYVPLVPSESQATNSFMKSLSSPWAETRGLHPWTARWPQELERSRWIARILTVHTRMISMKSFQPRSLLVTCFTTILFSCPPGSPGWHQLRRQPLPSNTHKPCARGHLSKRWDFER